MIYTYGIIKFNEGGYELISIFFNIKFILQMFWIILKKDTY